MQKIKSFQLVDNLVRDLEEQAKQRGMTFSQLVRFILVQWLDNQKK